LLNRFKSLLTKAVLSRKDAKRKEMGRKQETKKGDPERKPSRCFSVSNVTNSEPNSGLLVMWTALRFTTETFL